MYRNRHGHLFGRFGPGRGVRSRSGRAIRGATTPARSEFSSMNCCRRPGSLPKSLDAVAVGKGPGSYTGLRIGVSFAKGLCYGLRIPLVAIGSLDALTEVAKEDYEAGILSVDRWEEACLCPMVDARRMEVYTRVFDAAGTPLSDVSAEVVTAESFAAWRGDGRPFVIFGNGAAKCAGLLPDATLIQVAPSARGLARLAQEALDAGRTEDIAYFEPFYLKDFVVTRSKKKLF